MPAYKAVHKMGAMLVLYILHCWFCVHNLHSNYSVCFIQFSLRRFSELIRDMHANESYCTSIWSWVDDSEWNIDEPKETNSLYLHSHLCVCWLRLCQGHTTGRKALCCFQLSGQQRLKTCSRSAFRSGWQTVYNAMGAVEMKAYKAQRGAHSYAALLCGQGG